jgi:hypothetical protein
MTRIGTRIGLFPLLLSALLAGLACDPVDTQVGAEIASVPVYIEAEDGVLAGGFSIESDPTASGGRFIAPPAVDAINAPGNATATYAFRTRTPHDTYVIWGRIHGPGPFPNNSFWVSVDDAPSTQWRLSTGVIWWWGPITRDTEYDTPILYPLDAGLHHLVIRNSAPGVGLDALYIQTAPGHTPPGNSTSCDPPNSIQLDSGACSPSCGTLLGTVCGAQACAGFVPLPSYDCTVCCRILDSGAPGDLDADP